MSEIVERLLQLALEKGALKYGDFTLTSGKKSAYYFDGRLLSLEPEGAHLIGQALLPLVHESGAEAIGGPTLGADPIVAAVVSITLRAFKTPFYPIMRISQRHYRNILFYFCPRTSSAVIFIGLPRETTKPLSLPVTVPDMASQAPLSR